MNNHKNAKLTVRSREKMINRMAHSPAATVAAGFGVCIRTAGKWMSWYRQGGITTLHLGQVFAYYSDKGLSE